MKRTRGSGIEAKGSGNIEMEASPSDLGPLASDEIMDYVRQQETPDAIKDLVSTDASDAATYYLQYARGSDDILDTVSADTLGSIQAKLKADSDLFVADHLGMKVEDLTPDTPVTVYRVGDVKEGEVQSFSLDPNIGQRQLPGQRLRERRGQEKQSTVEYTVRAGDILAAPESTVPGISGLNEKEILIDGSNVRFTGDLSGPMVKEAGSDEFVPLEKKVGAPGTPGPEPAAINPLFNEAQPYSGDYSPLENVLIRSKDVLGAGKKGFTGEQMVSRLKKAGIKDDELESSGIASFIKENKTNRRPVGDYLEHYQKNAPDIRMEINDQEIAGGTQRIVTLPPGRRGEYEELVFFDQKVRDDPDLSPAATPYNVDHFRSDTLGPIGMARLDHIDDPITGGRATIGGEYQSDLTTDLARQARGESTGYDELVELTPERMAAFKKIDERILDHPKYKTLPDINNKILDADVVVRNTGIKAREARDRYEDIDGRFFTGIAPQQDTMRDAMILLNKSDLLGQPVTGTERSMARFAMQDRTANASRQAVYESMPVIKADNLSDDTVASAASLGLRSLAAENKTFYTSSTSNPKLEQNKIAFINQNEEAIKDILGLPPKLKSLDGSLTGYPPKLGTSEAVEFSTNLAKAKAVAEVAMRTAKTFYNQAYPASDLLANNAITGSSLMDDLAENSFSTIQSRMKEIRSLDAERVKAADEFDIANKKAEDAMAKKNQAMKDRRTVVKESINDVADNTEEGAQYRQYKYEREGGIGGVTKLDSTDLVEEITPNDQFRDVAVDTDTGQPIKEYRFVPNNPFKTQSSAIKYQINRSIKRAVDKGSDRYYFPDSRDIAEVDDRFGGLLTRAKEANDKEDIKKIEKQIAAFKATYDDVPNEIIKELQRQYPDLKTGTVDPRDFGSTGTVPAIQATRPMRYIDLAPLKDKKFAVRRYKRGGKVDMRSGIGDLFRIYS
jgi:hypothetical protein